MAKPRQPVDPVFFLQTEPASDRIVVNEQSLGDILATPAVVQQHKSVRPPPQPMRRRSVPRQGEQVGAVLGRQKAGANHAPKTNPKIAS